LNARVAAVLVMLLAVLGGAALLYQRDETARRPSNAGTLGQKLFKDLKAADIASIRIVEPKATLTLERKEQGWVIAERAGFPAAFGKVRDFVLKALELKAAQSEPIGEKDRARLNLDDPGKKSETAGTRVEFGGAGGNTLGALIVGKKLFRKEPENPEKALGDGRFVMLPGEDKTVYLVADPLPQVTARTAEWIDRSAFQVEKVKTLEVRRPDGDAWRIERAADNADWKLAGAKPGEKLDISRANAASYSLGLLELADVAPADAKGDGQMSGLDKPTLVRAETLDGLSYEIKVGNAEGDNYFVAFSSSGTLKEGADERLKKLAERLPREKLLSQHVLLVPKSKLEDTLKKRAELLERKEDRKK
jgi:hypothetical protein